MIAAPLPDPRTGLDDLVEECVEAYESSRERGAADLADFLPSRDSPHYRAALRELVRVDLEYGWTSGQPRPLDEYRARHPELSEDRDALGEVAFEEYRQRLLAGHRPSPDEYRQRYGVNTAGWPVPSVAVAVPATPPAPGAITTPRAGEEFLGFHLLSELGRGAFSRVFLASQGGLANRLVALKVGEHLFGEEQTLARLQHTNVVPVYSAHQAGRVQAVCMPYLGSTTLADVLRGLRDQPSLPASGKQLVSTLQGRHSTATPSGPPGAAGLGETAPPPPRPAVKSFPDLATLERLSYVEAVVWMAARLAGGLAHAHGRGIVHRDIKPSNILLTDEGQPMLLDFNLSGDARQGGSAPVGGTPSYMAPEQLEAFLDGGATADPRSDVYSLGVVLYEWLTGRHPYPPPSGPTREAVPQMLEQRRRPAAGAGRWNKAVSPAVEAVVRRCLDPDPGRRYPSALALQEDLDRHLAHLPLRHAREPSWRERLSKWARRHPRLASGGSMAALAAALAVALGAALLVLGQWQAAREASVAFERFGRDKLSADLALGVGAEPTESRVAAGAQLAREALGQYRVLDDPDWIHSPAVRRLPGADRGRLREQAADLLWALARADARRADSQSGPGRRETLLAALDLNRRAEACLGEDGAWRSLWLQRAELQRSLGEVEEAAAWEGRAARLSPTSARDHFLTAVQLRDGGQDKAAAHRLREAVALLSAATDRDPGDFMCWYLRAKCHDLLQENGDAVTCYTVCIALSPGRPEPLFNRGVAYGRQRRWPKAAADFDRVIELRGDMAEAHAQRGQAAMEQGEYPTAERHFSLALELDRGQTRLLFWRAAARRKAGDAAGAHKDREQGLRRTPGDAASWVERGMARLPADPKGALADFEEAIRLDPRYLPAWQDKAHVLSDHYGKNEDALAAMDRAVALRPDFVPARLGRGVLLARLGKRDEAHREAREALDRDAGPATLYQAANIYALTSRQRPEDRTEALPLLARALAGGFGLDVIDRDADMDPIRHDPEFRRIVRAARELSGHGGKPAPGS